MNEIFSDRSLILTDEDEFNKNRVELQKLASCLLSNKLSDQLSEMLAKIEVIYASFEALCNDENTKLICYRAFGGDKDIHGLPRYQLGLVSYNRKGRQQHSTAECQYVTYMCHLLNDLKAPRAGLLLQQAILHLVVERDLIEKIYKKPTITPEMETDDKQEMIQPDSKDPDWSNNTTYDKKTPRRHGQYLNTDQLPSIKAIKNSLVSGHGCLFFHNFERDDGTRMPSVDLTTGWFVDDDGQSKTAKSVFNRHGERMSGEKGSFQVYLDELTGGDETTKKTYEDAVSELNFK